MSSVIICAKCARVVVPLIGYESMNLISVNSAENGVGSALVNPERVMYLSEKAGSPNLTQIHLFDPTMADPDAVASRRMVVVTDAPRAALLKALGPFLPVTLLGYRADRGAVIHVRSSSILGVLPTRTDGPGPMALYLADGRKIGMYDVDELKSLVTN